VELSIGHTADTTIHGHWPRHPSAETNMSRHIVSVNYHFVRPESSGRFRLRAHEKPDRFDAQLSALDGDFEYLSCRDVLGPDRTNGDPCAVITFDDGARDVYEHALPILRRHDAKATVFVCSKPYLDGRLLQIQKVEFLMSRLGIEGFRTAFYEELGRQFLDQIERESLEFSGGYQFYRYDEEPIRRFKLDLNYQLPYAIVEPVLDAVFEAVFGPGAEAEAIRETYMSVDELKRLVEAGVEIGTHTHSHRVLSRLDFLEQKREMETSAAFLKEIVGESQICVAYPFGFQNDDTVQAARELDLFAGYALERRPITDADLEGRFALPRYDVNDCFDRTTNEPVASVFSSPPTSISSSKNSSKEPSKKGSDT